MIQSTRFLTSCQRRYGDIFTVDFGPFGKAVYLVDPAAIRAVFHGDDAVYHAGEANATVLERVLGSTSVLVTDEELHARQRRHLSGAFHGASVASQVPTMSAVAASEVETWPVGRPFAMLARMRAITLEVILRTVIGVRDPERLGSVRSALSDVVKLGLVDLAQLFVPALSGVWPWSRLGERTARADSLLLDEIGRARRDPDLGSRSDVLASLVRLMDDDGGMTTKEVRDQLMTLLLAGHETTATALAWAFERLVRHPAVLARSSAAARSGDDAYLDAVVCETLRSRTVVPDIGRKTTEEVELGGYRLPAGTYVDPGVALVHRDPRYYPEPERFDPERFVGRRPDPLVWLPFGGGSRRCLGAAFAATEIRVVLAEVLRRVELATTTARPERARVRHVTLSPHAGAKVTVRRRYPVPVVAAEPASCSTAP